jgi:hypothetical protein
VNRSCFLLMLLVAHRAILGTSLSRSVSGACVIERCSPWSVPFPPQPPRKLALFCSTGSPVLRHSPTSQHVRVRRLVYGLHGPAFITARRRAGDLPVLVHVVSQRARVLRLRRTEQPLASSVAAVLPSSISERSRHPDPSAFRSSIARPTDASGLRFTRHLAMSPARLEARVESLFSFPVGFFRPLQHAGLSRRTPVCRQTGQNHRISRLGVIPGL